MTRKQANDIAYNKAGGFIRTLFLNENTTADIWVYGPDAVLIFIDKDKDVSAFTLNASDVKLGCLRMDTISSAIGAMMLGFATPLKPFNNN